MLLETEVKEWGNSLGIIIPAKKVRELKLKKGDKISFDVIAKKRINGFGIAKKTTPFEKELFEHEDL